MTKLSAIFTRLENLIKKEGQPEFVTVIIANLIENDSSKQSIQDNVVSYQLLKSFLAKIFHAIDELSTEILNDDSILVSVKNQKLLRTCFQLIACIGISTCLIPGTGISLSKRCSSLKILPQLQFKDEEKYELLVECTNFFTRSYKVPVLRSIIIALHLCDYLAALIQLAFAPLKKPGSYANFVMTQEMYDKLNADRHQFVSTYNHLVANCFQPTLMKELLVLQSVVNPSPPAFFKRVIAKELSQRLLAPGGLLSLIRCFIESYEIDNGLEWKKIDMICRIVSAKHGTISEDEYVTNITGQLTKILNLNNSHYLPTAVACVLSLNEKYPDFKSIKLMIKDIFQVFDNDSVLYRSKLPGTIVLSAQEVEHNVNVLHACVSTTKDWHVSLLMPNLQTLFLIGVKCTKNEDLKVKLKDILVKCLEKLNKTEVRCFMSKLLFENDNWNQLISIEEYDSGIAIKTKSQNKEDSNNAETLSYFLDLLKSSTNNELIKSVLEVSLDILVDLSLKRETKANKDLLALEDEPVLLDAIDERYATILQLLSEISMSPKIITILKTNPSIVVNFIEHFIARSDIDEECTTISLVLLNTVLSNTKKNGNVEKRFLSITPILQRMSKDESSFNHILCKEALSLMSSGVPQQSESACGKAISDVFDMLLPVRAHGIIELTKLIDAKDAETISKKHYIFCIFQEQLKDPDSYIYLSAINGLASLCTHCTEDVLNILCNEFLQVSADQKSVKTNDAQNKGAEMRMKIGDVIVKAISRLGEMAVVHKTILLNTMLCGCRDQDPLVRASALSNLAEIARVLHYKMGTIIYELSGILLLGVGVWAELELYKYLELSPEFSGTGPLVIIGIGGLNIIISSIAFSCIIKGQPVLLNVYGGFLACIFMMIAGVSLSIACHRDSFDKGLQEGLTKTLTNYSPDKINFDEVQAGLKCCGVSNYTDWIWLSPNHVIPTSCCIDLNHCITVNYSDVYQRGCYKALTEFMEANTDILIGIAVGSAFFPLIGTVLAWSLAYFIKAANYDVMN